MIRGGKFLLVGISLATAGCTTTQQVQVRAIPDPAAKLRYGGGLLAEGRAQLAFGAAGTALETFRKLQREQPASPDAFAGIAACYAAMGRFDLERQNYEFALAYAPHDPALLSALASSLERQGETTRAAEIRQEIARLAAPAPVKAATEQANVAPMAVPRFGSVTVKLPPASQAVLAPAILASNVRISAPVAQAPVTETKAQVSQTSREPQLQAALAQAAMPAPHRSPVVDATVSRAPANVLSSTAANVQLARAAASRFEVPADEETTSSMMKAPQAGSVTVKLPPLRPAAVKVVALRANVPFAAPATTQPEHAVTTAAAKSESIDPADKPEEHRLAKAASPKSGGPYLERLSRGEVALVTSPGPVWRTPVVPPATQTRSASRAPKTQALATLALAASVQWVPLKNASNRPTIQLLNAARRDGLAASTRTALVNRGWRKIGIGNARNVREHSVVLYSPMRAILGRRLAAQFGFKAVKVEGGDKVLVLLGRDAATRKPASSRA